MGQAKIAVNKKKIAKNTIALYLRQIISIIISIYSVRVVLGELGDVDYGIYNVVGGVVLLFSFISHSMASSTQRFLSMSIPQGKDEVRKTFSDSFWIYVVLIILVMILSETIGVCILNLFLNIPEHRLFAANCVLQCTIVSFLMTLYASPYFALVITYEKMGLFALVSIAESVLKLFAAMSIALSCFDGLITYALLILLITLLTQGYYILYCRKYYKQILAKDKVNDFHISRNVKEMIVFAFWNLFRTIAVVAKGQGLNILLNIFNGPIINAARGIAYQIENALTNVVNSVYLAVRPQIFQLYEKRQFKDMFSLVYMSSKISFYLMMMVFSIFFYQSNFIIGQWLGDAPEYTIMFTKLTLANCAVDVFVPPLLNAIQANGNIGKIQLLTSIITIVGLPVTYVLLRKGDEPTAAYVVSIGISITTLIAIIIYARETTSLSIREYVKKVLCPAFCVTVLSQMPLSFIDNYYVCGQTWKSLFLFSLVALFWGSLVVVFCGLSANERNKMFYIVRSKVVRL